MLKNYILKQFTKTNCDILQKIKAITLYKRIYSKVGISFNTKRSEELLKQSIKEGSSSSFFHLIDQHQTQSEPSYCGPATLVTILNSLGIDPRLNWKGYISIK
jgi:glutathione gamma-glutamylcysteinyltransferase